MLRILVLIGLAGLALGCGNRSSPSPAVTLGTSRSTGKAEQPSSAPQQLGSQKPDFALTAEQLTEAYAKDKADADRKYKGKLLVVEGPVNLNNTSTDRFSLELQGAQGDVRLVKCFLDKSLKGKLPKITLDMKMKLQGRCKGLENDYTVGLADCVFVSP